MSELQRIVTLGRRAQMRGEQLCLATVVHVEGSAYRKPGARMLLTSGGDRAGTISGGCLESEISRKAWWLTAEGPRVERYSSFADEDAGMPYGLGCGGTVTLLLEQGEPAQAVLAALERTTSAREPAVVITTLGAALAAARRQSATLSRAVAVGTLAVLNLPYPDRHALTEPDQTGPHTGAARAASNSSCSLEAVYLRSSFADDALPPDLVNAAQAAFAQQRSQLLTETFSPCDYRQAGAADAPAYFVEYLGVPPALTVFGAGDDVQPIADLAQALGWRVSVADGRAHLARRERFPKAAEVRVLDYADPALRAACGMDHSESRSAARRQSQHQAAATLLLEAEGSALLCDEIAVVMTHSYEQDRALLSALLPRRLRYLGILGPRHRTERLLGEITPRLGLTVEEAFARLHSPIGLDLGATDPSTVALSIVAEIQASLHERAVSVQRPGPQGPAAHDADA